MMKDIFICLGVLAVAAGVYFYLRTSDDKIASGVRSIFARGGSSPKQKH